MKKVGRKMLEIAAECVWYFSPFWFDGHIHTQWNAGFLTLRVCVLCVVNLPLGVDFPPQILLVFWESEYQTMSPVFFSQT